MKIVADENIPFAQTAFSRFGDVITLPGRHITPADLTGADALIVRSVTTVNRALLEQHAVRFVGTCTIGRDHIDCDYLQQQGIAFADAAGCNANAVSEYVITALLSAMTRLNRSVFNARIGIVGFGNVGQALQCKLNALGIPTLINDPPLQYSASTSASTRTSSASTLSSDAPPNPIQHKPWSDLKTLLSHCDVVCFHTPLTDTPPYPTRHLLNHQSIAWLQPGTILLNAGRGDIIDEKALMQRMQKENDLHLILDVWQNEPNINSELLSKTMIGTPHIAGYSWLGKVNGTTQIAHALQQWYNQQRPPHPPHQETPFHYEEQPEHCIDLADVPMSSEGCETQGFQALLQQLLNRIYPIHEDDHALKTAQPAQNHNLPKHNLPNHNQLHLKERTQYSPSFDSLRRTYPVRLEWSQVTLKGCTNLPKTWAKRLTALGFNVITEL